MFRVIGLSKSNIVEIDHYFLGRINYKKEVSHENSGSMIVLIILDESATAEVLKELLAKCDKVDRFDFIIAVSSEEETAMIDVPEYVLELCKKLVGECVLAMLWFK